MDVGGIPSLYLEGSDLSVVNSLLVRETHGVCGITIFLGNNLHISHLYVLSWETVYVVLSAKLFSCLDSLHEC